MCVVLDHNSHMRHDVTMKIRTVVLATLWLLSTACEVSPSMHATAVAAEPIAEAAPLPLAEDGLPWSPAYPAATVAGGKHLFKQNCANCHQTGAAGAPALYGVTQRLTRDEFEHVLDVGPRAMPSWKHLPGASRQQLWAFLASATPQETKVTRRPARGCGAGAGCGGGCGKGKANPSAAGSCGKGGTVSCDCSGKSGCGGGGGCGCGG